MNSFTFRGTLRQMRLKFGGPALALLLTVMVATPSVAQISAETPRRPSLAPQIRAETPTRPSLTPQIRAELPTIPSVAPQIRADIPQSPPTLPPGVTSPGAPGRVSDPAPTIFQGTLDENCSQLKDGSFFRVYEQEVEPGLAYEVRLNSNQFDAFLWLQEKGPDISVQRALARDDDSGGGTNALIRATFTRKAKILIVVNSLRGGEKGNYTLEIRRAGSALSQRPGDASEPRPSTAERDRQINALRAQIGSLQDAIRQAEDSARQCDQEAAEAARDQRLTSVELFRSTARSFRDQASQYRQQKARAELELQRALNGN